MLAFDRIQLVILSHNRLDCLPRLFNELLLPAANNGVQVTFVDNASGSEVRQFLAQFEGTAGLQIVLLKENLGVAAGRNEGFRRCQREFAVYLDDDALVPLADLERVPAVFDELPDAAVLAFRVVHGATGVIQNEHGTARLPVGNFHGAAHAIRQVAFTRIGYLDEFCFFGAEEVEYAMRARTVGWTTIYTPEIQAAHLSLERAGRILSRRRILWARNYAMVLFRYLPYSTAGLFCVRLFAGYFYWGFRECGVGALLVPGAMVHGAIKGMMSRNPLDAAGAVFYRDPNTRPECGNVSLWSKAMRRLRRTPLSQ